MYSTYTIIHELKLNWNWNVYTVSQAHLYNFSLCFLPLEMWKWRIHRKYQWNKIRSFSLLHTKCTKAKKFRHISMALLQYENRKTISHTERNKNIEKHFILVLLFFFLSRSLSFSLSAFGKTSPFHSPHFQPVHTTSHRKHTLTTKTNIKWPKTKRKKANFRLNKYMYKLYRHRCRCLSFINLPTSNQMSILLIAVILSPCTYILVWCVFCISLRNCV